MTKKPLCLIIRDGWGRGDGTARDLIATASTPFTDKYEKEYPTTLITTSGIDVGLPKGVMGNSEVGHLNIGAGRVVYQSLTRINKDISEGKLFENEAILKAIAKAKDSGGALHLMGLIQNAGVHSTTQHAIAILEVAKKEGLSNVLIHAITDGRDTSPTSAKTHLQELQDGIDRVGIGKVVTVTGRYYAMDRDNRMERTELAYRGIMEGIGEEAADWNSAIDSAYAAGENDEFVKPRIIDYKGISKDDGFIFFNFRFDRTRQFTKAVVESDFDGFKVVDNNLTFVAMTHYYDNGNFLEAFPELENLNSFGETLSKAGLKQLRCAETEKFAHVTFFFNSLKNDKSEGEEWELVKSPNVATYDLQPEMSAFEVRDKLVAAIESEKYDVIITNFANCDMVGHTGIKEAIDKAVSVIDTCVNDVVQATLSKGGVAILTADHGNADQITLDDGSPMTSHSMNPVPLTLIGLDGKTLREGGSLCDIAPTCLEILGEKMPKEMTGKSLIV